MFKILLFTLLSIAATAQNLTRMATATGTNNYAATFNPPLTSFNQSTVYVITFTNANTSTTLTLDPAGAVIATSLKDDGGVDIPVGALKAGGTYSFRFDGTNLRLIGSASSGVSIYSADGALTGNRVLTGSNLYSLAFNSLTDFNMAATGDIVATSATSSLQTTGTTQITADGDLHLHSDVEVLIDSDGDIDLDATDDVLINGASGVTGQFIGNVNGHLVWATPAGSGGSSSTILDVSTSTVGNITTGEDVLYTYTLPADSLNDNGDILRGRISGFVANNANAKTIRLSFGSTDILSRGTTTPSIGQGFTIDWEVIRTGATSQKTNATFSGSDGTASAYYTVAGETLSGSVNIVLTGEATSTDDIVKETSYVYLGVGGGSGGVSGLTTTDFVVSETPTGAVNGVNDTYTLANTPSAFVHVYLDGLLQDEGGGDDYTISGDTITMNDPPLTGSKVRVSYIK